MTYPWQISTAPAFAQIVKGELVRLSTILPEFDGRVSKLRADHNTKSKRVAVDWYSVTAPKPSYENEGDTIFYSLVSIDKNDGSCILEIK